MQSILYFQAAHINLVTLLQAAASSSSHKAPSVVIDLTEELEPTQDLQAPTTGAQQECTICMDSYAQADMHQVVECQHTFCRECLDGHISAKLEERKFPIPCPGYQCAGHLSVDECGMLLRSYDPVKQLLQVCSPAICVQSCTASWGACGISIWASGAVFKVQEIWCTAGAKHRLEA